MTKFPGLLLRASMALPEERSQTQRLLPAVEVVPLAACAAPVVIGRLGVGQVVGILGLHVVEARGLVEVRRLGIESRGVLAVQLLRLLKLAENHLQGTTLN
jgi:hypothetical protein